MKKRNDVDLGEPGVRAGEIWPILRSPQKAAPSQSSGASLSAVSPEFLFFKKKILFNIVRTMGRRDSK